jgi:uncharacterized membrane protein YcaP (DUF421 family)
MDTVIRVAFVYFLLMVILRVMGKRELSEMSPFELVTLLLIPEIFSPALAREDYSMTHATIGVATLCTLVFATALLTFRSKRAEVLIEGEPTILVRNGKFIERHLQRERITPDEIVTEMHKAGVEQLEDLRWAILEVDGKISIIPRESRSQKRDEDHPKG